MVVRLLLLFYYYYLNLSIIILCDNIFHWLEGCKILNVSKDITLQYDCKAIIILSITILCGLECFKRYHLHYWCIVIIIIIWPLFHPFSGQLLAVWIFILFNFPFSKTFFPFLQGPNFWAQYMSLFFLVFPSSFLLPTFKTYNFERVKVLWFLIF